MAHNHAVSRPVEKPIFKTMRSASHPIRQVTPQCAEHRIREERCRNQPRKTDRAGASLPSIAVLQRRQAKSRYTSQLSVHRRRRQRESEKSESLLSPPSLELTPIGRYSLLRLVLDCRRSGEGVCRRFFLCEIE